MKKFDRLIAINGQIIPDVKTYIKALNKLDERPVDIQVERGGELITKQVTPIKTIRYIIGVENILMKAHPGPWKQFTDVIDMTYKSLRGIFSTASTLKASHLSGPLGIVRGIAITVHHSGVPKALALIVMISYSLAILNLMPLPVLDGGHIVLAVIEQARGGKLLPAKLIQPVFILFIMFLISMMLFVTFHDIMRMRSITKKYQFEAVHSTSILDKK